MAARPMLRKLTRELEANGGIEYLCERIANGEYLKTIAADFSVSPGLLMQYIKHRNHPERLRAYRQARLDSATVLAEESREAARDADPDAPGGVQKARLTHDVNKWLAERYDKDTFGQPQQGQVLMIGELHLNALRRLGGPENQALPSAEVGVLPAGEDMVDAEIITDEDHVDDLI